MGWNGILLNETKSATLTLCTYLQRQYPSWCIDSAAKCGLTTTTTDTALAMSASNRYRSDGVIVNSFPKLYHRILILLFPVTITQPSNVSYHPFCRRLSEDVCCIYRQLLSLVTFTLYFSIRSVLFKSGPSLPASLPDFCLCGSFTDNRPRKRKSEEEEVGGRRGVGCPATVSTTTLFTHTRFHTTLADDNESVLLRLCR